VDEVLVFRGGWKALCVSMKVEEIVLGGIGSGGGRSRRKRLIGMKVEEYSYGNLRTGKQESE
jgi:hypothetical protein